jgi:hypothetical protein
MGGFFEAVNLACCLGHLAASLSIVLALAILR